MLYSFKTSAERSNFMRRIKSVKTTPEILFQKALRKEGIKFKTNYRKLPGSPDIAITNKKVAVFIDGEFWHGYNWKEKKKKIKANRAYWIPKIARNIVRDKNNSKKLYREGWKVVRFWQQQIIKDTPKCIERVKTAVKK